MTMWRFKALLIFTLIMGLTTAFPGSPKEPTPAPRVLRIGGSSSNNNNNNNNNAANGNNYSVSFVPLFSLIANFLPKLLARFTMPPGSRSLDQKSVPVVDMTKGIFCSPQHIGRWRDVTNCHQFYTCEMNPDAPPGCHNFLMGRDTPFKATDDIQVNNSVRSSSSFSGKQMDSYKNSCVTVKTFVCPSKFVFSDETKECVSETQMNIC
ncbi:uncharacterized protein [Anabrus simplex]|uniref:uncharacterized protein isoform X2 n=1 Tax=Anabrus simplex TaxID=316456 RepID=UPI0035A2C9A5